MRSYFSQQPDLRFLVFHAKLHEHNEKKIENISSGFSFLVKSLYPERALCTYTFKRSTELNMSIKLQITSRFDAIQS